MNIGIMQPYLLPYIGYFQLISSVDIFVIYDDVQYIKKGWINKNRILINDKAVEFVISIKKDSSKLRINERFFTDEFDIQCEKILLMIDRAYKKSPYFDEVIPVIRDIFRFRNRGDITNFIIHSLKTICEYLDINTTILKSSEIRKDNNLKGEDKIIEIVKNLGGDCYINSYGGMSLYSKENFRKENLELKFIKPNEIKYCQFSDIFVPNLSIVDVMMFNSKESIIQMLEDFKFIF